MKTTIVMTLIMVFICSVAAARDYWSESKTKESTVIAGKTEYHYVQKGVKYGTSPADVWEADKEAGKKIIYTFYYSETVDPETGRKSLIRGSMSRWIKAGRPKQVIVEGRKWHPDVIMLGEPFPAMPTDEEIEKE